MLTALENSSARDNHGIRSRYWRFLRYADGSEELYDMRMDPHEFTNLVRSEAHAGVIDEHRKFLPAVSAPPAQGSRSRILIYKDGQVN